MIKKLLPYAMMLSSLAALASCSAADMHKASANNENLAAIKVATGQVATQGPLYTITFNACNGNEEYIESKGRVGEAVDLLTEADVTVPSGKYLVGWSTGYSGKMGDSSKIVSGTTYVVSAKNEVLYAVWGKKGAGSHTQEEIDDYIEGLKDTSEDGHLYFHYYRYGNEASNYDDWDIWCWPYYPARGEGYLFDFNGKHTNVKSKNLDVTGSAIVDEFGGAVADIDMTQTYDGGWNNTNKTIGGSDVSFYSKKTGKLDTKVGVQIVKSSTRINPEGEFWTNDGADIKVDFTDPEQALAIETKNGGVAYHVFALQDKVQNYGSTVINDVSDPYEDDDGTNVTVTNDPKIDVSRYDSYKSSWDNPATIQQTSPDFASNAGVGYQIQVATYADSDGDGFGDIYGITQKIPYLKDLGIKALWLTPVQKSDSYHGYDISDYEKVDVKFGSLTSPNCTGEEVTEESAMKDYEDLIDAADKAGIRIVMDLVLNHSSTSNKWFINSAQLSEKYRGYYQWGNHDTNPKITEKNCWLPYGDHVYSYYAKFGSSMPELNYMFKDTRDAVKEMTNFWIDKGVRGFRLDAVKHIFMADETETRSKDTVIYDRAVKGDYSSNLTKNLHFYRDLNASIKAKNPNVFIVGENFDGHAYRVAPWYKAFDSMFDFYGYFNLTTAASKAINVYQGAGNGFNGLMQNTGTYSSSSDEMKDGGNIYGNINGKYAWSLPGTLKAYNALREKGRAINGMFTSNHDIARNINRIAGTEGDSNGITEQGTVTSSNYTKLRKASDCVKSAQILMPGLTWIYYGDEIGMTGNFPAKDKDGKKFTSQSDYADLYWRQPMKWKQDGTQSDGSMTTGGEGLNITGSGMQIAWDSMNASTTVGSVETQLNKSDSELNLLKKVIAYKNANPSMITGELTDNGSTATELKFKNGNISVSINLSSFRVTASGGNGSLDVTFK